MNYIACGHGEGAFKCPACLAAMRSWAGTKKVSPDQPGAAGTNPAKGEK